MSQPEISHDDRVTFARNAEGMDILSNDTPREQMQTNMDTRVILIHCKQKLYNETAEILGMPPITNEDLKNAAR